MWSHPLPVISTTLLSVLWNSPAHALSNIIHFCYSFLIGKSPSLYSPGTVTGSVAAFFTSPVLARKKAHDGHIEFHSDNNSSNSIWSTGCKTHPLGMLRSLSKNKHYTLHCFVLKFNSFGKNKQQATRDIWAHELVSTSLARGMEAAKQWAASTSIITCILSAEFLPTLMFFIKMGLQEFG